MRLTPFLIAAGIVMASVPAMAGSVTVADGKLVWQSTQCTAPEAPPAVTEASSRHTRDEDVNKRIIAYNDYVQKAQAYMDCLSKEAQADAKIAGDTITGAAQQKIDEEHKSVDALAPAQPKK